MMEEFLLNLKASERYAKEQSDRLFLSPQERAYWSNLHIYTANISDCLERALQELHNSHGDSEQDPD